MPIDGEVRGPKPFLPPRPRADGGGVVEKPVPLLLPRQADELLAQRKVGWLERLLELENGWVGALGVAVALQFARSQRQVDAAQNPPIDREPSVVMQAGAPGTTVAVL